MAGELKTRLPTTGLTVKACLVNKDGKVLGPSTPGVDPFVAWNTLNLTNWRSALIACTEQVLSSSEPSGLYLGDLPAYVAPPVIALYYSGATPSPGDSVLAIQELTDVELMATGLVVSDPANSTTSFLTNLTGDEKAYLGRLVVLASGNGKAEPRRIAGFNSTNGLVTLGSALSAIPTGGAAFTLIGMIEA